VFLYLVETLAFRKKNPSIVLAWKSGLSPLQLVMAIWCTIIVSRGLSHPTQKVKIQTKRVPNCQYYLQKAVTPDWKGSIAL
jgi:hypothetical protein